MINAHAIQSLLAFYLTSDTYYRIHSPFLFELLQNTLEDGRHYYDFDKIEELRKTLQKDKSILKVKDLGAGSKTTKSDLRSVKDITNSAVSPPYQSRFLYKLVMYTKAKNIIELGTSMGISTLYLSSPASDIKCITLEGSQKILEKAKTNFQKLGNKNITTLQGHFDDSLPKALRTLKSIDLCYIDGNHAKEPTLKYFEWCLPYTHEGSVLIFDDIYWSSGMTEAWEEIKKHPKVKLTLDMYYFGIVFFNSDIKVKQDFKVLNAKYKIWQRYI